MSTRDPRVDTYIAKAAPFAQPVLVHLREVVHGADPEAVETIKWGMPFFVHGGRPLVHMAAFKAHCAFGFWQGRAAGLDLGHEGEAMGQFGRITGVADLPPTAEMQALVRSMLARQQGAAAAPRRRAG